MWVLPSKKEKEKGKKKKRQKKGKEKKKKKKRRKKRKNWLADVRFAKEKRGKKREKESEEKKKRKSLDYQQFWSLRDPTAPNTLKLCTRLNLEGAIKKFVNTNFEPKLN